MRKQPTRSPNRLQRSIRGCTAGGGVFILVAVLCIFALARLEPDVPGNSLPFALYVSGAALSLMFGLLGFFIARGLRRQAREVDRLIAGEDLPGE